MSPVSLENINKKLNKRGRITKELNNLQSTSRKYNRNPNRNEIVLEYCTLCEQSVDAKKMCECRSCKFKKCQECAAKEEQFSSVKFDVSVYTCKSCIQYEKPR